MSIDNVAATIRSNPIFAALTKEEAEQLANHSEVLILPPNFRLFSQGEISEDMYVLFHGDLILKVKDAVGEEMEVGMLNGGEVFGEMGVLEKEPRSASIYTGTDCVILRIPGEGFYKMIEKGLPAIHLLLQHTLEKACFRLRELDRRLDVLFNSEG